MSTNKFISRIGKNGPMENVTGAGLFTEENKCEGGLPYVYMAMGFIILILIVAIALFSIYVNGQCQFGKREGFSAKGVKTEVLDGNSKEKFSISSASDKVMSIVDEAGASSVSTAVTNPNNLANKVVAISHATDAITDASVTKQNVTAAQTIATKIVQHATDGNIEDAASHSEALAVVVQQTNNIAKISQLSADAAEKAADLSNTDHIKAVQNANSAAVDAAANAINVQQIKKDVDIKLAAIAPTAIVSQVSSSCPAPSASAMAESQAIAKLNGNDRYSYDPHKQQKHPTYMPGDIDDGILNKRLNKK